MSRIDTICLYVFSGPHVGAEIVLPQGSYTIGTDDSCDIILKDAFLAPKHARIDITIGENATSVVLIPLEGDIWVNNEAIPKEGYKPKAGEFWYLGGSCLAWNVPGTNWQNKAAQFAETLSSQHVGESSSLGMPTETLEEGEEITHKVLEGILPKDISSQLDKSSMAKLIGIFLLIFFIGALAISYQRDSRKEEEQVKFLQQALKDSGFMDVSVIAGTQQIIIRGFVQNDTQRQMIYTLAQGIHTPVYIDVGVRDDLVNAIKTAFASRGIFISVKENNKPGSLTISGYMKDGFVEEWSISAMREDVPIPFKLEKNIVYAKEVSDVLQKIFAENKVGSLKMNYLAGEIEITGSFDSERIENLEKSLEEVKKVLGVPIVFKVNQVKPAPIVSAQKGTPAPEEKPEETSILGTAVVKGVTTSPIPFITLSTGERIFKGGVLPSGYALGEVSLEKLIFYKDSQSVEYPLRGAN